LKQHWLAVGGQSIQGEIGGPRLELLRLKEGRPTPDLLLYVARCLAIMPLASGVSQSRTCRLAEFDASVSQIACPASLGLPPPVSELRIEELALGGGKMVKDGWLSVVSAALLVAAVLP
jgi:hypothetical protein